MSWGYGSDHHETYDDRSLVFEWKGGSSQGTNWILIAKWSRASTYNMHSKHRKMQMENGLDENRCFIALRGLRPCASQR